MVVDPLPFTWRNHEADILSTFRELFRDGDLVDVTLACDGAATLEVHKIVLSASSMYFRTLFQTNRCKHPVVIVGNVKYRDMKALVDFMYNGTISVPKEQLSDFLKTAKLLQIRGLEARLEDVIQDSSSMTQNTDRQPTSHDISEPFSFVGQSIPRSSSFECPQAQDDVSVHTNDESEFMETVVVKDEPEYNSEVSNMESHNDSLTTCFTSTRSNVSLLGRLNAEQQNSQTSASETFQSDGQICNIRTSLPSEASSEPAILPGSITSGQGNEGTRPQTYLFTYEEPPKVLHSFSFGSAGQSPSKPMIFGMQTSNTSLNTVPAPGLPVVPQKITDCNMSPRKEMVNTAFAQPTSSTTLNSSLQTGAKITVESQKNDSLTAYASFRRNCDFHQNSTSKRNRSPVNYIHLSKFGKSHFPMRKRLSSRSLDPDYDCKCTQRCASRIPPEVRSNIFSKFWSLENCAQQSAFIRNTVSGNHPEENRIPYRNKKGQRRCFKRIYKLGGIVVCYQMYANTLRINTKRINEALSVPRNRIKKRSHLSTAGVHRLPETKIREVICYLEKFFDGASYNSSTNMTANLGNRSLQGLYTRYKHTTAFPVTYYHFAKVFRNNFTSYTGTNGKATDNNMNNLEPTLPNQITNFQLTTAGQSSSNSNADHQQVAVCSTYLPVITESAPTSMGDSNATGKLHFRKLAADRVRKVVAHFNKLFSSTSQWDKGNRNLSNHDLWKMYKIYKTEDFVPVSFTSYVKIFNLCFRQNSNEGSAKETTQHSRAENSVLVQECSANETSAEQNSTNPILTTNETRKIIKHFSEFYDNPSRYKRIGFSAKSSDPPLQKMYEIYKKDEIYKRIPLPFDHYVDIFHTSFKSCLSERYANRAVKDPATKISKTVQSNKKKTTGQQRNIKVGHWQSLSTLPIGRIREVTDHFNKLYNNPSHYKRIGFSVKSADPPLCKMYEIYKSHVASPIEFHYYAKIFYNIYKDSLSKRNEAAKTQNSSATKGRKRGEHLEKSQLVDRQNLSDSQVESSVEDNLYSQGKQDKANGSPSTCSNFNPKSIATTYAKQLSTEGPAKLSCQEDIISQENKNVEQEIFDNVSPVRIAKVIDHFKEFYDFVSSHNEAKVPLEFVNHNLPLMKMYNLYRAEVIEPVSYQHFLHIFLVNFKCPENQSKSQNSEVNQVEKSDGKDSGQNVKVTTNSSCQKEPVSILRRQRDSGLHIDACTDVKFQNAVVQLSKIDIPLLFQQRASILKADEGCTSENDSKQQPADVKRRAKSTCTSNKDLRDEPINANMLARNAAPCSSKWLESVSGSDSELSCILSADGKNRGKTVNDKDTNIVSKLLAEMIERIEHDSAVSCMNDTANEVSVTIEDDSMFKKDTSSKDLLEQVNCTLSSDIATDANCNLNKLNDEKCD